LIEQIKVVFNRAMLGLRRDKMALFMAAVQPPILAILTSLAGTNQPKSIGIIFFMVVCAIWLGMTLTVREIVRERKLYIRDRLAGMSPLAYLLGKMAFAGVIVTAQATVLWVMIKILGAIFMQNDGARGSLESMSIIAGWIFLTLTGIGAAMLGLLVSTLSKSERAAVGLLPLVLLPQVVLSRALTSEGKKDWSDPSPYLPMWSFVSGKPMSGPTKIDRQQYDLQKTMWDNRQGIQMDPNLMTQLTNDGAMPSSEPTDPSKNVKNSVAGDLNLLLSSVMLTRPATASIDMLGDPAMSAGVVFFEFLYLMILLVGYGAALYYVFMYLEKGWNDIRSS
jgi:hypothetical protein